MRSGLRDLKTMMNNLDRCDRCGAQALVRVLFQDENLLDFCNHHANEYADAIVEAGGVVMESPCEA
jgi:hypothetical protein